MEETINSTLSSNKINDMLKELAEIIAKRNEVLKEELKAK